MKYSFSFLLLFCGCLFFATEMNAQPPATMTSSSQKTITVKVTGVGCSTDVKTIGANVEKIMGVTSCVPAKRGAVTRFEVSYDPNLISEEDIHQAIQATPGCSNPDARPYRVKVK